jgi:cytochrome c biogenesis protein CcdA
MKAWLLGLLILVSIAGASEVCLINDTSCSQVPINEIPAISGLTDAICINYFWKEGCSNCVKIAPYLDEVQDKYGSKIDIHKYDVGQLENIKKYQNLCNMKNIPLDEQGVPLIAINDKIFMGVAEIRQGLQNEIDYMLKNNIRTCLLKDNGSCGLTDRNESDIEPIAPAVTLPLIIGAGLLDGINPCAFAVLIFLLTFLLTVSKDKRRMIKAGIAYVVGVYVTYFLAGLGLLTVIHLTGFSGTAVKLAGGLAIIVGLINIKDYFWYGKWISLGIPKKFKPTIERWTHRANIPAAFILGLLVAMFELPCTGGVYLAIIALLAHTATQATAIGYLLLYNLMFILPLLFIMYLVTKGMSAERIENWRQSKKSWMKLAMGILLVGLGLAMVLGLF